MEWSERNKLPHLRNVMNEAEREKFILEKILFWQREQAARNAANQIKNSFNRYVKTEKARVIITELEQQRLWVQWQIESVRLEWLEI